MGHGRTVRYGRGALLARLHAASDELGRSGARIVHVFTRPIVAGRVTRSRTTAPLRSLAPLRYLSIDSLRASFFTRTVLRLRLQPGPLQVSFTSSPVRTGLTVSAVNWV